MQNEYYYKLKLEAAINKFVESITSDKNELGYLSDNIVKNMTEASWLILKQNYDLNQYLVKEGIVVS